MKPRLSLLVVTLGLVVIPALARSEPAPIPPEQFSKLHRMIRVQPEELRFWRIPWKLRIADARAQAAAEGKPILIWAGAGGAPIGVC
jgi:hypothetical protein